MTTFNIDNYPNAKKAFEAWYNSNCFVLPIGRIGTRADFYDLNKSMQFGVLVDFIKHKLDDHMNVDEVICALITDLGFEEAKEQIVSWGFSEIEQDY